MKVWWVSFADESGFLGGCAVAVDGDFVEAIQKTHRLGINPGGEARGAQFEIPEERVAEVVGKLDHLYSLEELGDEAICWPSEEEAQNN